MLTFLAVAARMRIVVDAYEDAPVATVGKDAEAPGGDPGGAEAARDVRSRGRAG